MKNSIKIAVFIFFCISAQAQNYSLKVAILGNSITQHGPLPDNGWFGNWGMAASAKEKDFVHLIDKELKNISPNIELKYLNIADFEKNYKSFKINTDEITAFREFAPDLLLLRIGDNLPDSQLDTPEFHKSLQALIDYVANGREEMKVILTNSFWTNPYRDYALESFIGTKPYHFADLKGIYAEPANTATDFFKDINIARHPSDLGMAAIKERIWKVMSRDIDDLLCAYYNKCNYCQEGTHTGYLDEATCDTIRGWVIDEQNFDRTVQVDVFVDDKLFVSLLANEARPDLPKVYGPKGLNHGFKYTVPAGAWWKDGQKHMITVKPCWEGAKFLNWSGKEVKCSKPDEVKNQEPDYVANWLSTECNEIVGWVYDKNNLSKTIKVDFLLNNEFVQSVEANQQRPDLLHLLTYTPDAVKHIFAVKFADLPNGNYDAQIKLAGTNTMLGNINNFQCPKVILGTEYEDFEVSVYPNPNQGGFKLKIPAVYQKYSFSIFDILGNEVKLSRRSEEIILENASNGLYFLKITVNGKVITKRIIVD